MLERTRLGVEHRNRLNKGELSSRRLGLPVRDLTEPHRFSKPGRREHPSSRQFSPVLQHDAADLIALGGNPPHARTKPKFAAQAFELAHQLLQYQPHAGRRSSQTLQEDRAEHDGKLAEIHVPLAGAAVIEQGAKNHLGQEWIVDIAAHHLSRRRLGVRQPELFVSDQLVHQPAKTVDLAGEPVGHLRLEKLVVVGEAEGHVGKRDRRTTLLRQRQFVPREPQLAEEPGQGAFAGALGSIVGHRVQTDVVVSSRLSVVGVQTADRRMPLQDTHLLVEVGQTNPSRQTRHAGADNDSIVHGSYRLPQPLSREDPPSVFGTYSSRPAVTKCHRDGAR